MTVRHVLGRSFTVRPGFTVSLPVGSWLSTSDFEFTAVCSCCGGDAQFVLKGDRLSTVSTLVALGLRYRGSVSP